MNSQPLISLCFADERDREHIYAIRHQVYARELGQYPENEECQLRDALDAINIYLVATVAGEIAGFVSITPPNDVGYSIDKYFARDQIPLTFDRGLFEVRLLTVSKASRANRVAAALMYAAWRYIESQGGRTVVCIGRLELLGAYQRVGLQPLGRRVALGSVTYDLMGGEMRDGSPRLREIGADLEPHVDWCLQPVRFHPGAVCYHGGAFFEAIGDELDDLSKKDHVINADVLDAWFDPAPSVVAVLTRYLPWAVKTSPPTGSEGMRRVLSRVRGVDEENILPAAGSSDLIFLGLRHWLRPDSRVLILDPMYGEYAHVLERVVGCRVDRLTLARDTNYSVDCDELGAMLSRGYDLVVLVNPNSPTGQHVPREKLEALLGAAPCATRFWIDETYVEYVGPAQSLERFAASSSNVVVCKSMSKVYALSGARCAYLCGPAPLIAELQTISPPWAVSLPGQIAACEALRSTSYYVTRWEETHAFREQLAAGLRALGWDVVPGCANFLLCHLPADQPEASDLVNACRRRKLFIRDVANMGSCFGPRTLRVAVKDTATNAEMLRLLRTVLAEMADATRGRVAA